MADIFGTPGDDTLNGTSTDDTITTYEGNDTVNAEGGDDLIIVTVTTTGIVDGGTGSDTIRIVSDNFFRYPSQNGNQMVSLVTDGGTVSISNVERFEVVSQATGLLARLMIVSGSGDDTIDLSVESASVSGNTNVYAGDGNDTITVGNSIYAYVNGGNGADILTGGTQGGTYVGGAGGDIITGGAGNNDRLDYVDSNVGVTINLDTGAASGGHANGDSFSGIEDILGSFHNDDLTGDSGNNVVWGYAGEDTLTGLAGSDTFQLIANNDYFNDTITDLETDDFIRIFNSTFIGQNAFTNTANEIRYEKVGGQTLLQLDTDGDGVTDSTATISNGEFDLVIHSNFSNQFYLKMATPPVEGTSGDDMLTGTAGDDVINAFAGDDTITTLSGNDTVDAGDGDDVIIADSQGHGSIDGGAGLDIIRLNSPASLGSNPYGAAPTFSMWTSAGAYNVINVERLEFYNADFSVLESLAFLGSGGDDIIDITSETLATQVNSGTGNDEITGGSGGDRINAGPGEDVIYGNDGFNILGGGEDFDVLIGGDDGNWLIGGAGPDNLIGGTGYDVIWYTDSSEGVTVNLSTGESTGGTAEGDAFIYIEGIVGSYYADTLSGDGGDNNISARGGDDIVMTYSGNDSISGEDGDDIIDAGAGDDHIYGNMGNDTLTGGSGADQFFFNQLGGAFTSTITDFEQGDSLAIYDDYTVAGDDLPTFIGTDAFSNTPWEIRYEASGGQTNLYMDIDGDGVTDETLTLSNGEFVLDFTRGYRLDIFVTNTIYGTSGDDDLYGTFGDDVIDGLAGNDTFYLSPGADTYDGNDGNDTVDYGSAELGVTASLATGQGTGGEASGDSYVSIENLRGSDGSDVLTGDENANILYGEAGNDYLRGGAGNDIIEGGFGADYLRGGAGADDIRGGAGQDWTDYSTSPLAVTIDLSTGTALGGDADGDVFSLIERVLGSTHDDMITGDGGINYLRGWSGDDTLVGGAGNDYLQGDLGADTLDGGAGINDWAYYASSTSGLTVNMGDTSLNTGEAVGDTYINIENLTGSRYNDHLTGDSSNNQIRGFLGDDMLFGGDGRDFLRGDEGADVHDGGNGLDWAYYVANSTAITIDLGTNTATGGQATGDTFFNVERVFGSRYDDSITGDSGANYLRGYLGNDTLIGGDGNDFLQGDAGADTMDGGEGSDWVYYYSSTATGGLTISLADASINTGEASGDIYISIENVVGSQFNDLILGDSGNNYLRGAQGDDIIEGGAGDDILRGEAGSDTFVFDFGTGSDTVIDFNDAEDWLDFSAFGGGDINPADYAVEIDGDVVITIGSDVITIENTTILEISDNVIL